MDEEAVTAASGATLVSNDDMHVDSEHYDPEHTQESRKIASTSPIKRKGRGFKGRTDHSHDAQGQGPRQDGQRGRNGGEEPFEGLDLRIDGDDSLHADRAQRSVEGWIVLLTNVHEECTEEDLLDRFSEYGHVQTVHLNLDRRTGYVKGYALIEYATRSEAERAIKEEDGKEILEQEIRASWAFWKAPTNARGAPKRTQRPTRQRSRSPGS